VTRLAPVLILAILAMGACEPVPEESAALSLAFPFTLDECELVCGDEAMATVICGHCYCTDGVETFCWQGCEVAPCELPAEGVRL
jgi:hypothetical protein